MNKRSRFLLYVTILTVLITSVIPAGLIAYAETTYTAGNTQNYVGTNGMIDTKITPTNPCAKGHSWGDTVVQTEPSCTSTGTARRRCILCGTEQTITLKKESHVFTKWTVEKPATCTEEGISRSQCVNCGCRGTRTQDPLGHQWGDWIALDIKPGSLIEVFERTCKRCGEKETREEEFMVLPAHMEDDILLALTGVPGFSTDEPLYPGEGGNLYLKVTNNGTNDVNGLYFEVFCLDSKMQEFDSYTVQTEGANLEPGKSMLTVTDYYTGENDRKYGPVTLAIYAHGKDDNTGADVISNPYTLTIPYEEPTVALTLDLLPDWPDGYLFIDKCTGQVAVTVGNPGKTDLTEAYITVKVLAKDDSVLSGEVPHKFTGETLTAGGSLTAVYTHTSGNADKQYGPLRLVFTAYAYDHDSDTWYCSESKSIEIPYKSEKVTTPGIALTGQSQCDPKVILGKGDKATARLTLSNTGDADLTNVIITVSVQDGDGKELSSEIRDFTGKTLSIADSVSFDYNHTLSAAEAASDSLVLVFTAHGLDYDSATVVSSDPWSMTVPRSLPEEPEKLDVTLLKSVTSTAPHTDDKGDYYDVGDDVTFTIEIINGSDQALENLTLYDEYADGGVLDSGVAVQAKTTRSYEFTVKVPAECLTPGILTNTATLIFTDESNASHTLSSDTASVDVRAVPKEGEFTLKKQVISMPKDKAYRPGETITYLLTVSNKTDSVLSDVAVIDPLKGENDEALVKGGITLVPSAVTAMSFEYIVTEDDVKDGKTTLSNQAFATGTCGELTYTAASNTETVPVAPLPEPEPEPKKNCPDLVLKKTVESEPKDGSLYTVGEEIIYRIYVENNTGKILTDVRITDPLKGEGENAVIDTGTTLLPTSRKAMLFTYQVKESDIKEPYKITNQAFITATMDGETISSSSEIVEVDVAPVIPPKKTNDRITIMKKVDGAPENGSYYVEGETITYIIRVANNTQSEFTDITVEDPLISDDPLVTGKTLAKGESHDLKVTHVVTKQQAKNGTITNTARVTYKDKDGTVLIDDSFPVMVDTGITPEGLVITKTVEGAAPHAGDPHDFYSEGDIVKFVITIENPTDVTFDTATVYDDLFAGDTALKTYTNVDPGFSDRIEYDYHVTMPDCIFGSVTNVAGVVATKDGEEYESVTKDVTVYTDILDNPELPLRTGMLITKEETSKAKKNGVYMENEDVVYTIRITNTGYAPIYHVTVYDQLNFQSQEIASFDKLLPSETWETTYTHKVTSKNVEDGVIYNRAVAMVVIEGVEYVLKSDLVTVYTGKPIPPEPPHTDTPVLKGDSCVLTLIDHGDNAVSYCQHYCQEHGDILALAEKTPENERDASYWKRTRALWQTEVESLYNAAYDASNAGGKAIVLNERMCFFNEVNAAEALLLALDPNDAAAAYRVGALMMQDRCASLCYELHNAPAPRPDTKFGAAGALTIPAAAECGYTIESRLGRDIFGVLVSCDEHAHVSIFDSSDTLVYLKAILKTLNVSLDSAGRKAVRDYTSAVENRQIAHRSYLNLLYGDNALADRLLGQDNRMRTAFFCAR